MVREDCWLSLHPDPSLQCQGQAFARKTTLIGGLTKLRSVLRLQERLRVIHSCLPAEDLELPKRDPILESDLSAPRSHLSIPFLLWLVSQVGVPISPLAVASASYRCRPAQPEKPWGRSSNSSFKTACFSLVPEVSNGLVFPGFL